MQLKIQRSQRAGGMMASTVFFCLDVRADYSPGERTNINRYKLGGQIIYSSQAARRHAERANAHLERSEQSANQRDLRGQFAALGRGMLSTAMARLSLNISIASLGRGHHVECKDLEEMLDAEDTIRNACKNLTRYLQVAETFDGSELVVEYRDGEEQVHITQHAPPLLEAPAATSDSTGIVAANANGKLQSEMVVEWLENFWANPSNRKLVCWGLGALALLLLLRSCFG